MLNLKAYNDELFRVDEVMSAKYDEWLRFDERYFYKPSEINLAFLAHTFDLDKGLSDDEVKPLLSEPIKNYFLEGTFYSLNKALKAFYDDSKVLEWFDYDGKPYHFKLNLETSQKSLSKEALEKTDEIVNAYKNVRSVYDGASIIISSKANLSTGSYVASGESIDVYPFMLTSLSVKSEFFAHSSIKQDEIITVKLDLKGVVA
ncbi:MULTISPECIES: phage tail protein [unclassified Campylobacter]|uniref:phage tail protein n=1 Tax=unclassified Campylobacter TaxID=2593542 RepID=UPI003D32D571